jgi:long-chain acyl-CoA synthetase
MLKSYHKSFLLEHLSEVFSNRPVLGYKEKGEWSFMNAEELHSTVNQITDALAFSGIGKGDKVLTILDNSHWWNCWDFAIGCVGAIHISLSMGMHRNDIVRIAEHCSPNAIILLKKRSVLLLEQYIANNNPLTVVVQKDTSYTSQEEFLNKVGSGFIRPQIELSEDDVSAIMYRSDTLENLNGAIYTHKSQLMLSSSVSRMVCFGPLKSYYQFLPISSALIISSSYVAYLDGITSYIWDGVTPLSKDMQSFSPDVTTSVPFFLSRSIRVFLGQKKKKSKFAFLYAILMMKLASMIKTNTKNPISLCIRHFILRIGLKEFRNEYGGKMTRIVCGGAITPIKILRIFKAAGINISTGYGLVESGTAVSICPPEGCPEKSSGKIIDIKKVKVSEDGEFICKSEGQAQGFFKDEDRNKHMFDSNGYLHTGDLGYIDNKGNVFFTGRKKNIFKVSSAMYVEPKHAACLLEKSEYIDQACVLGHGRDFALVVIHPSQKLRMFDANIENHQKILMKETNILYNEHVIAAKRIASVVIADSPLFEQGNRPSCLELEKITFSKYGKEIEKMYKDISKRVNL